MKKRLKWLLIPVIAAVTIVCADAITNPPPPVTEIGTPKVTLEAPVAVEGDSLEFTLRWEEPEVPEGSTAIEGYEWEAGWGTSETGLISEPEEFGLEEASARTATVRVPYVCGEQLYVQARVRAAGSWSEAAPWGESEVFAFACENLPPGAPPVVSLDTVALDSGFGDESEAPNGGMFLLPIESDANNNFSFVDYGEATAAALGGTLDACVFLVRDREVYVAREQDFPETLPIVANEHADAIEMYPIVDGSACYRFTSLENTSETILSNTSQSEAD